MVDIHLGHRQPRIDTSPIARESLDPILLGRQFLPPTFRQLSTSGAPQRGRRSFELQKKQNKNWYI